VRHATTVSLGERRCVAVVEADSVGPASCSAPVITQQGSGVARVERGVERRRRRREGGAVPTPVDLHASNDTQFGLASGVFTRDLARAHRMIRQLRAGIVWVNTYRAVSPIVPFGGYGNPAFGREGGAEPIRDYTRVKSVWIRTSDDPIPDPFVMR
jgi:hypothetical protein